MLLFCEFGFMAIGTKFQYDRVLLRIKFGWARSLIVETFYAAICTLIKIWLACLLAFSCMSSAALSRVLDDNFKPDGYYEILIYIVPSSSRKFREI